MIKKTDALTDLVGRIRTLAKRSGRPTNATRPDWFKINNADGETAELFIYGVIGDDWDVDDVTAGSFTRELRGITAPVVDLHINSPGGYIFDGVAIHTALLAHPATVNVYVDGIAASSASFVAMAGDSITVAKPAKMMIHDGQGVAIGNAADMLEMAALLDDLSDTIAGIYADRAGGEVAEWRDLMRAETWFSAEQAVTAGLADQVGGPAAENKIKISTPADGGGSRTLQPVMVAKGLNRKEGTNVDIDAIMAALKAITDGAKSEDRPLTNEEAKRFQSLEADLANKQTDAINARMAAYEAPAPNNIQAVAHIAAPKPDDGLDKAFENYLRTGQPNADISGLRVTNAQGTTPDSAGGYTVPAGFRQKLVEVQKSFGGLAPEVEEFSTETGNPLEYPSLNDTASEGAITAESAAVASGQDLVFGTINLGAWKYTSAGAGSNLPLRVPVELGQDAAFDIAGLVSRALGTRIARKQARDWVVGAGTTLPFGIAHAGLTANVTLEAGNALTYQNLLDIETALDPAYEQSAKWAMNKATWQALRALVGSDNRPLIQESAEAGIGGAPQRTLLGYPVVIDQAFPNHNTLSAKFAVLGDLREAYVIRRVSNLVVVVNPWTRASNGEVEYLAWERADGNIQNRSAYSLAAANAA